ncbi:hypothetical protein BDZ97DRAFT_1863271 [Flammula alnicola]|nr:hypothetical protein BDZ97DRAFT_1863271 [Flammula alnicola]
MLAPKYAPMSPKGDRSGPPRPSDHSTPTTRPTADELHQHSTEWNPGHKLMVLAMCRNRTHNLSDGAQPPLKATQ